MVSCDRNGQQRKYIRRVRIGTPLSAARRAPGETMTAPATPLEVVLSARAMRLLRAKPHGRMSTPPPGHFLTQWRVDPADDGAGASWYIMTNLATLYTFLLPRSPDTTWEVLVRDFRVRLGFALLAASPPLEWKPATVIPVSGNPRAAVGSMNNMAQLIARPFGPAVKRFHPDLETMLQRTPFSALGTPAHWGIPDQTWQQRLDELSRLRHATSASC